MGDAGTSLAFYSSGLTWEQRSGRPAQVKRHCVFLQMTFFYVEIKVLWLVPVCSGAASVLIPLSCDVKKTKHKKKPTVSGPVFQDSGLNTWQAWIRCPAPVRCSTPSD